MSKLLPAVLTVARPENGAVHVHHTDFPPALPPWFGSENSFVALLFTPLTLKTEPAMRIRFAKASLGGRATNVVKNAGPFEFQPDAFRAHARN